MATGTAWPNSDQKALWHLVYDINADDRGFTTTFKVAEATEADAMLVGIDLGKRLLTLLPTDSEIFFAKLSRDDSARDALMIPEAMGPGTYQSAAGPPAVNPPYDAPQTCLVMRLEDSNNVPVPFKLAPIPDNVTTGGALSTKPDPVRGMPGALPADNDIADTYAQNLNKFMAAIVKQTHHIIGGHSPGAGYTYFPWKNCYMNRLGKKKGGHVFIG